jgi:hypothetical protein
MKSLLTVSALLSVVTITRTSLASDIEPLATRADAITERKAPARAPAPVKDHPTPRLKLSYQRFSAGNVDGTAVPLEALHLDLYALSWRWLRTGLEVEAGRGHATLSGASASLKYGLIGMNAGLQIPGRVTPFFEGQLAAGVLGGTLDGALTIPGTTVSVSGVSAATWMYARGLDAGIELYAFGRSYLSLALGWVRTTWGSASYDAMVTNRGGSGLRFQDVTHDSFLLKLGIGI